jgi:hypothetical protein
MLQSQRREGSGTSINILFMANTLVNSFFYPLLLIYLTFNLFIFPMSYFIGKIGCVFFAQFLDVFIR